MEVLFKRQRANLLVLHLKVKNNTNDTGCRQRHINTNAKQKMSPIYFINDLASFQVSITYPNIFVRFVKLHSEDPLDYVIKLSCDEFLIKDKIFNENNTWHLIHSKCELEYTFKLMVYLEVLPITNSFALLHADTELTDFELRGNCGSLNVHKLVLAASSPVFRKKFTGKWKRTKKGHIDINDTSKTTLNHLRDYVYLHKLPDTGLEQLLLLASCYKMPDLEQKRIDKLVVHMRADNVCELLKFAIKHDLTKLWLSILEAIQENMLKVQKIREHLMGNKNKLESITL